MRHQAPPQQSRRPLGDGFTVTTNTTEDARSALGTDPLVTLLLGVAIGAGAVGLIFSWK